MGKSVTQKIIEQHLLEGNAVRGEMIRLRVDQTLVEDLTGILPIQGLAAIDAKRVRVSPSIIYCDHNTLQVSTENSNDQKFLRTSAARYGLYYSKAGNGICHCLHLERFAVPGQVLLGADSHTQMSGAVGMLAIGSGGLNVLKAMMAEGFCVPMPGVMRVELVGSLNLGVSAKDVALELLRRLSVKGAVQFVLEFGGSISGLSVMERGTITNMCTEMGATASVFPSDEETRKFMRAQGRESLWKPLFADEDAEYDEQIQIVLDDIVPLAAVPHMPDKVVPVSDLCDKKVDQVFIGSCTNASYLDHLRASKILRGHKVNDAVSLSCAAGSKQIIDEMDKNGILADYIHSGARILECACGPCVGAGQAPCSKGVSVRTSNRNFIGRGGTPDAEIYLVSPETAAATAINGYLTDPRTIENLPDVWNSSASSHVEIDDSGIIPPLPQAEAETKEVFWGSNISELPRSMPLPEKIDAPISLKCVDNITTDDIIPATPEILKHISDIPSFAQYAFLYYDKEFVGRCKRMEHSVIIGGENYGQGSSREHAALIPMYLGVKAVIAKSFARIHRENLINFGILPLTFSNGEDYDQIRIGDQVQIESLTEQIHKTVVKVHIGEKQMNCRLAASEYERELLQDGGLLNYLKRKTLQD